MRARAQHAATCSLPARRAAPCCASVYLISRISRSWPRTRHKLALRCLVVPRARANIGHAGSRDAAAAAGDISRYAFSNAFLAWLTFSDGTIFAVLFCVKLDCQLFTSAIFTFHFFDIADDALMLR